ncbi:MAG TPA: ABC transporter permease, partial [Tepidiformaceae bacterium]|nr:ABC transporter permease [Tepidiformaceae bacterium]
VQITTAPFENLEQMMLPALTLGLAFSASVMRTTRSAMLEVLNQDYIRTASAKGLSGRSVVWLHALKNAMLPIITIIGLFVGNLLAGAAIVETIFAIPGLGRLLVASIGIRDFPVIQLLVLIVAVSTVVATLLTDVAYAMLDPRIRYR